MRAIHNFSQSLVLGDNVVPDVKDTNLWEQFTTLNTCNMFTAMLFLMSKIRTYESNSQPFHFCPFGRSSCSWCQRYELMRAIHNNNWTVGEFVDVVPDVKDTNLWEQFTTLLSQQEPQDSLFLMSKIRTYESNSQLLQVFTRVIKVVPDVKDTNLWEQFTTPVPLYSQDERLFLMSKIRTYESNSQLSWMLGMKKSSCSWCQRYELMRAIHNLIGSCFTSSSLFLMSKIRTYESNSQLKRSYSSYESVVPDVKDTNLWEQFTTAFLWLTNCERLFLMSKIRTYESNSQHIILSPSTKLSCSWCQRYELMRAIHNLSLFLTWKPSVVPDVKDTNLWEQFTTDDRIWSLFVALFLMSKIRTYESNSQLHLPL